MSILLDILLKGLRSREAQPLDYVELHAEDVVQMAIDAREAGLEVLSQRVEAGHSARVLHNGAWGFAVGTSSSAVASTISEAAKAARASRSIRGDFKVSLADVRPIKKKIVLRPRIPLHSVDPTDKVRFSKGLCKKVVASDVRIATCKTIYREVTGKRYLATSEGTSVEWDQSLLYLMASASGKDGGIPAASREEVAAVATGWEHLDKSNSIDDIAARLARKMRTQMDGIQCKRGSFPCVLGPKVVGILAHEALGHLAEADYFSSGAFYGLEGKEVAPDFITMVDSPSLKGSFGDVVVDDEGSPPTKVTLIAKGMLGEQLTNREWAGKLGTKPTGNARAETYRVPPIIRMRNTYIERGDMSLEELLEGVKFGYYCADVRGGQAESNSSFQVGIQECFQIEDGNLTKPVRDLAISGVAVKSLMLIDGLGKDFGIESSYCGKMGQSAATSDGGPHMRLKKGAIIFGGAG